MAEELLVVLNRHDSASGFGFSLLGKPGLPPIIYQILEDSPAAESGEVEVGDVILKVNETDVNRFTTKEVLKCLRLSEDPVTLKIKRDPNIKATVQRLGNQASTDYSDVVDCSSTAVTHVEMAPVHHHLHRNRRLATQHHLSSNSSSSDSGAGDNYSCQSPELVGTGQIYAKHKYPSDRVATTCSNGCSSNQTGATHCTTPPAPSIAECEKTPLLLLGSSACGASCAAADATVAASVHDRLQWAPLGGGGVGGGGADKPKYETFMMTGEHILKISNTTQVQQVLPKQQKKNESGRYHNSHVHHLRHTPPPLPCSPPYSPTTHNHHHHHSLPNTPPPTSNDHHHNNHYHERNHSNTKSNAGCYGRSLSLHTSPIPAKRGGDNSSVLQQQQCCSSSATVRQSLSGPNSVHTSPIAGKREMMPGAKDTVVGGQLMHSLGGGGGGGGYFVRTSRSEDQLQPQEQSAIMSAVDIDLEDDVTSSLNTLLDPRQDAPVGGQTNVASNNSDRIVWTYNAPVTSSLTEQQHKLCHTLSNGSNSTTSSSSSSHNGGGGGVHPAAPAPIGGGGGAGSQNGTSSPSSNSLRSTSPASPTSVSSSIMSSSHSGGGGRRGVAGGGGGGHAAGSGHNAENGYGHYQQPQQQQQHGNVASHSHAHSANSQGGGGGGGLGGDYSISEAVSNISSPDYHDADADSMLGCCMEVSDQSDSDSTLLVSEPRQSRNGSSGNNGGSDGQHRIVIQVKAAAAAAAAGSAASAATLSECGGGGGRRGSWSSQGARRGSGGETEGTLSLRNSRDQMSSESYDFDDADSDETVLRDDRWQQRGGNSPPISEDESDIDSLHSFHHYSPKAVDLPSAIRLAKRLYALDGFKKSDVSRHLSKANEFSRAVADEYLRYFSFDQDTLDLALRKFLKQFSLTGETQERERVLVHFSKRFLDCNPGSFNSQDAVHTLTCAIMLLNTDLHGQNMNRKMTCNEFIENLAGLNENENFPREVLKQLYHAIKNYPLEWALDEDVEDNTLVQQHNKSMDPLLLGRNPFLDVPCPTTSTEHKKGYVMRKCCYEQNAKRTPFHKRGWKMYYMTLRDLLLYLHKDEAGAAAALSAHAGGACVRVHHALATVATDYTKKQHVFRLQTADQAEYLFQTSDSNELQSWIDMLNLVCARYSARPLEAAVGSQKKFQRPLLPCSHTKLSYREQLKDHEERVMRLDEELKEHNSRSAPERGAKALVIQNYKEKEVYLHFELKRYRCYVAMLRTELSHAADMLTASSSSAIGPLVVGGNTGGAAGAGTALALHPCSVASSSAGLSLVQTSIGELDEATLPPISQYIPLTGSVGMAVPPYLLEAAANESSSLITLVPPPVPERRSPPISSSSSSNNNNNTPVATNRFIVHVKYFPKYESPLPNRKSVD